MPETISILFIGDVVANAGMMALRKYVPELLSRFNPDALIINGENICDGKGLTEKEAKELYDLGAQVITTGNHIWENWKARPLLIADNRVLRPHNYPRENPGKGFTLATSRNNIPFGVIQVQGRTYMQAIDCPFKTVDSLINRLREDTPIIIVDFHAEATGEKVAMGWHLDGRVSAMLGTHTHVQTADARVLPGGTAYITDVGMTGAFDSVLGMNKEVALKRFTLQTAHKYVAAEHDIRISGALLTIEVQSGKALAISSFIVPSLADV